MVHGERLYSTSFKAYCANRYPDTPGIYSRQQVEAWKPVVQSVKKAGAVFVSQIWHVGRASHGGKSLFASRGFHSADAQDLHFPC